MEYEYKYRPNRLFLSKNTCWLKYLFITGLASLIFVSSWAQKQPYRISVVVANDTLKHYTGKADSLQFTTLLKKHHQKWLQKGHVLAYYQMVSSKTHFIAFLYPGKMYKWGKFDISSIPETLLSKAGFNRNQFNQYKVNAAVLGRLLTKIIEQSDYTGYPFASVSLDSVTIKNNQLNAVVKYKPGPQITFGALVQTNTPFIKSKYLEAYLGIKEGEVFNSKHLAAIPQNIKNLPFAHLESSPKLTFEHKQCKVALSIKPVKANTIDALLGLAPNQPNAAGAKKTLITGYVNLHLQNLFKAGKELKFNWRQFGVQSQQLMVFYNHTQLLHSPVNIQGSFDLFKQDTSFINRNGYVALGYTRPAYQLYVSGRFRSSRLISAPELAAGKPLELIDFNTRYFGVNFTSAHFDNPINPHSGWQLQAGLDVGNKNILSTNLVPPQVYDTLPTSIVQGEARLQLAYALPITKLWVAYSALQLAGLQANGALFTNDLFRLGGIRSIRGFNELQIYASSYALLQIESRILLSENSRLFVFADAATTQNRVQQTQPFYLGLGAGMVLETPSGVFQIVYALGKSSKQSLSLAESKIHFGYVARF